MESADSAPQALTPRPARRRVRAISTTIAFVLISIVMEFAAGIFILFLPTLFINNGALSGQIYGIVTILTFLLLPMLATTLGGMYWLALRGLQYNRVRVVWLHVVGLGIALFLLTGTLINILDIATSRIVSPTSYYAVNFRLSSLVQAIARYPLIALIIVILAIVFASVIVNIARLFTKNGARDIALARKQGWRDFLRVWGLTTFMTCACSISQVMLLNYYASIGSLQGGSLPVYITLVILVYFIIPSGIVATIACADMLRTLQNPPIMLIPPEPSDPFASSDGSFSLSFSPITEND